MILENIAVVLVRPDESRNIGAACRAMANNGIGDLRIVGKREDYDEERIRILAIHSAPIWERARFFDSVSAATADCTLSAGTTRRRGKKRKGKLLLPEEFAGFAERNSGQTAIVFGNERIGLTDEELAECTMGVSIPSHPSFASLNLSHAVQILCYHIFRKGAGNARGYTPIDLERLGRTVSAISASLKSLGFFVQAGQEDMERFWRDVLSRAALSEGEAQYIEKTFSKISGLASKNLGEQSSG